MEKRMKKMDVARNEIAAPKIYGVPDAELTLVCWGSTFGVALEAADSSDKRGNPHERLCDQKRNALQVGTR